MIDEVVRSLKSGKEATVIRGAFGRTNAMRKVYRDMGQRSFQRRAQYQEGRKVRGSRQARAMGKSTRFGKKEQESAWKNAEVDALYQLVAADVRVPRPYGYFSDVLLMEMVTDADGDPAPRLGKWICPRKRRLSITPSSSARWFGCSRSASSTGICPSSTSWWDGTDR
ncbi:MAG: RIO1 family regulatory kinase/ATPase [Steroidobacteraceae bacterium]